MPFIFLLFLFGLYLLINYGSKKIIRYELNKKHTKRISQTKITKTITRRGKEYDYEFPLAPNLDGFRIRLLAKVIDFVFYLAMFYALDTYVLQLGPIKYLYAFLSMFMINPFFEAFTGRTIGKFICRLRVIDDFGDSPSLLTSFLKNILQLSSLIFHAFSNYEIVDDDVYYHNKKTYTYTIWNKDKKKILAELNRVD